MPFFEPIFHAFGLDIGDRSIKAVNLVPPLVPRSGARLRLHAWNHLHIPEKVIDAGEIHDERALISLLQSVVKTAHPHRITGTNVIASLPESKTFVKTIEIPRVDPTRLMETIIAEAEQHIPIPLAEASFDWQILGPTAAGDRLSVIVGAVPRAVADSYADAIEHAGLTVYALEIEAIAIARSLQASVPVQAGSQAIIDIGATRSSFIVAQNGAILLTVDIPLSGNDMTARIAERLKLGWNDAEKIKIACGLDPSRCAIRLRTLVDDLLRELVGTIRNAIRFSQTHLPEGRNIDVILLTGGGANIVKLENILSQKLLIRVRKADPTVGILLPKSFPTETMNSFSTAIGLAIRATTAVETVLDHGE